MEFCRNLFFEQGLYERMAAKELSFGEWLRVFLGCQTAKVMGEIPVYLGPRQQEGSGSCYVLFDKLSFVRGLGDVGRWKADFRVNYLPQDSRDRTEEQRAASVLLEGLEKVPLPEGWVRTAGLKSLAKNETLYGRNNDAACQGVVVTGALTAEELPMELDPIIRFAKGQVYSTQKMGETVEDLES